MDPRRVAAVNSVVSLVLGGIGLAAPELLGRLFGVEIDGLGAALARLACVSYLAFALLAWRLRVVTEARAWRAAAAAFVAGWSLSAVVVASAMASGVADARATVLVVLQIGFAAAWGLAYGRSVAAVDTASSLAS